MPKMVRPMLESKDPDIPQSSRRRQSQRKYRRPALCRRSYVAAHTAPNRPPPAALLTLEPVAGPVESSDQFDGTLGKATGAECHAMRSHVAHSMIPSSRRRLTMYHAITPGSFISGHFSRRASSMIGQAPRLRVARQRV